MKFSKRSLSTLAIGAAVMVSTQVLPGTTAGATSVRPGAAASAAQVVHKPFSLPHAHRSAPHRNPGKVVKRYTTTALLPAGASQSTGTAINNVGQVAVTADDVAYLYTKGTPTKLSLAYQADLIQGEAKTSNVLALNDRGQMIGQLTYLWSPANVEMFNLVSWASPTAVPQYIWDTRRIGNLGAWMNNAGVGLASGLSTMEGFMSTAVPAGSLKTSQQVGLYTGLSDDGQAVGQAMAWYVGDAFVQDAAGNLTTLPGLTKTEVPRVAGMSNDGTHIVGTSLVTNGGTASKTTPVYWDAKRAVHALTGAPAGFQPVAVNNAGTVVGTTVDGVPGVWSNGTFVLLPNATSTPGGLPLCMPKGINNSGQIVASVCAAGSTTVAREAVVVAPKG